jgi:hypothetical protein
VFDVLRKDASFVLDGFNDQTSISNIFEIGPPCTSSGCVDAPIPPLTETFVFPATMLGKPEFRVSLMSTTFDNILGAIRSLIRRPSGCFE